DQVLVRVADIDGGDRPHCARALARPLNDGNAERPEVFDGAGQAAFQDKADIRRARSGVENVGIDRSIGGVEVYLLLSKAQRLAASAEGDLLHSEHTSIEIDRPVHIADGQDEVIEAANTHINREVARTPPRLLSMESSVKVLPWCTGKEGGWTKKSLSS